MQSDKLLTCSFEHAARSWSSISTTVILLAFVNLGSLALKLGNTFFASFNEENE
jgi:hypothetical protein